MRAVSSVYSTHLPFFVHSCIHSQGPLSTTRRCLHERSRAARSFLGGGASARPSIAPDRCPGDSHGPQSVHRLARNHAARLAAQTWGVGRRGASRVDRSPRTARWPRRADPRRA